ncbi:MAG TPA: response regulator [Polyangiaceae bacterium]|nr:response regulator [Polyangiaceae bacterium]
MKTVLVVEDTTDMRELLVDVLETEGYRVLAASHGQEALETLHACSEKPAVILLDWMMPVMDGPAFLQALYKEPEFSSVPVVVVSAIASLIDVKGVARVFEKPVRFPELRRVVRDLCGTP